MNVNENANKVKVKKLKKQLIDISDRLDGSIKKSKDRFIFNERKIEALDSRMDELYQTVEFIFGKMSEKGNDANDDHANRDRDADKSDLIFDSDVYQAKVLGIIKAAEAMSKAGYSFEEICEYLGVDISNVDGVEKACAKTDDKKDKDNREDVVNHPSHYTDGKYEVIDFIHQYAPIMDAGNAVKYISRAGKKDEDKYVEDLKKARWYLYSCHELIHSFPGLIQFCTDYRKNYCTFTGKEKINVGDYCKDKKLPFELVKVINYIVLDEYYTAYCEINRYIGFLEELGHEPN